MRFALVFAFLALLTAPLRAEVRWQLECQPNQIGTVTVRGIEGAGIYGYMTFTVTNKTGREVALSLGVWADTDVAGHKPYRGTIDPVVKEWIEARAGKTFKTLNEVRGEKLADGASVELMVSFGKLDANVDLLDINILGLCDRVYRDKGKTYVEDKVLRVEVVRPGDEFLRQYDLLRMKGVHWKVLEPAKELKRA